MTDGFNFENLKEIAKFLNVKHSYNIKETTLRAKIDLELEELGKSIEDIYNEMQSFRESENGKKIEELKGLSLKNCPKVPIDVDYKMLVKCKITNNDPNKKNYTSDIITIANRNYRHTRCIPYGKEWYIPRCFVECLKEKTYNEFYEDSSYKPKSGELNKSIRKKSLYTIELIEDNTFQTTKED